MITIKFLTGWNAHLLSHSQNIELGDFQTKPTDFQKIIEKVMQYFDVKDYLYAIFQAMSFSGVSPFIATHDYCLKVLHCDHSGTVEMNVSPIYHLGLEYPEDYKTKHGRNLDQEVVIGLFAKPAAGTLPPGHTSYSYGVDAGVLFKDSTISHNKKLTLKLDNIREGLLATLSCEKQSSSTTLSWADVGCYNNVPPKFCEPGTEIFPGDWSTN